MDPSFSSHQVGVLAVVLAPIGLLRRGAALKVVQTQYNLKPNNGSTKTGRGERTFYCYSGKRAPAASYGAFPAVARWGAKTTDQLQSPVFSLPPPAAVHALQLSVGARIPE